MQTQIFVCQRLIKWILKSLYRFCSGEVHGTAHPDAPLHSAPGSGNKPLRLYQWSERLKGIYRDMGVMVRDCTACLTSGKTGLPPPPPLQPLLWTHNGYLRQTTWHPLAPTFSAGMTSTQNGFRCSQLVLPPPGCSLTCSRVFLLAGLFLTSQMEGRGQAWRHGRPWGAVPTHWVICARPELKAKFSVNFRFLD